MAMPGRHRMGPRREPLDCKERSRLEKMREQTGLQAAPLLFWISIALRPMLGTVLPRIIRTDRMPMLSLALSYLWKVAASLTTSELRKLQSTIAGQAVLVGWWDLRCWTISSRSRARSGNPPRSLI